MVKGLTGTVRADPVDRELESEPFSPGLMAKMSTMSLARELLSPGCPMYLVHGGPGTGKSSWLRGLADLLRGDAQPLKPIGMSEFRSHRNPEELFRAVASTVVSLLAQSESGIDTPEAWNREASPEEIAERLSAAIRHCHDRSSRKIVLLFDDFQDVHPWAGVHFANLLRRVYDVHKEVFSCVFTAASALEKISADSGYYQSPFGNVSCRLALCDLDHAQTIRVALDWLGPTGNETLAESIWRQTRGYASLTIALSRYCATGRVHRPDFGVADAATECLQNYLRVEPLRSMVRAIDRAVDVDARAGPARILKDLARGVTLSADQPNARELLALGTLGWAGTVAPRELTWRNPITRSFWEDTQVGAALIDEWLRQSAAFRKGQLAAQGTVYVSYFLDLGELLSDTERDAFDRLRGTQMWVDKVRGLADEPAMRSSHVGAQPVDRPDATPSQRDHAPATGNAPSAHDPVGGRPFQRWMEHERLVNFGYDLSLFRGRTIGRSFLPVYEASTIDLVPDFEEPLKRYKGSLNTQILHHAREALERQWQHWDWVHIQITRGGAIHLTLIRDLRAPLPLAQILNELLGLERDITDGRIRGLSVQWEMALAVVDAFMRQVHSGTAAGASPLGIDWQGFLRSGSTDGIPYPMRDRYVIYLFRKLCNCRSEQNEIRNSKVGGRIVPVAEINDPASAAGTSDWSSSGNYSYARELTSLLEGVMVHDNTKGVSPIGLFPDLKASVVNELLQQDLASWSNELFVATLDNALCVYQATDKVPIGESMGGPYDICLGCDRPERCIIENLFFPHGLMPYEDYWRCITLGLQYIIELRWVAQWITRRTTNDLDTLAELIANDGDSPSSDHISKLTQSIALNTRLLSHLRDASIPMSIANADYGARKYEQLIAISGLRQVIENAEKDILALVGFLQNHQEQLANRRADHLNRTIFVAGGVFTVVALFVALPSMWLDFSNQGNGTIWSLGHAILFGQMTPFQAELLMYLSIASAGLVAIVIAAMIYLLRSYRNN